jgi:glycosyl transferase/beta-hydroxylase protein BlmF
VYIDDDDDTREAAQTAISEVSYGCDIQFITGPRIVLTDAWNRCYERAHGDILMHCGDDIRFRTDAWDDMVREAFSQYSDHIALVYGRDGVHDKELGTHSFLHRRWVETIGYFLPPYFSSDYGDTWINDVAKMIGRRHYIPNIYTEHMHPVVGKGPMDQTHRERLARGSRDGVDQLYLNTLDKREADARTLTEVLDQ